MFEMHFLMYFSYFLFIFSYGNFFVPCLRTFNLMSLNIKVKTNNIFVPESFCLLVAPHDFKSDNMFND